MRARRLRVAVVGAGLGGLSAACHLAGAGHEVVVLERSSRPGGRAGVLEEAGYRLDTGPSVLTMRPILEETFAAAGTAMEDHLTLRRVDPAYRACFAAGGDPLRGGVIHIRYGREAMHEELRATCGTTEAAAFERFARWLTELYQVEMGAFIARNYDSPWDLARQPRSLWALARLGGFRRLAAVVAEHFSDPRLRKLFSFQAMYAGLAPDEALALYAVITYMDCVAGVWFPMGGMHALAEGLAAAAAGAGADLRYESEVESIARHGAARPGAARPGAARPGPVAGVRLAGGELVAADVVVANPDLPAVYRDLLGGLAAPRAARRGRYSPSAAVWVAGVGPAGAQQSWVGSDVGHHNVHFSEAWEASFDELIRQGRRMSDPSILVSVPSVTDPSLAPRGRALMALEPVPNTSAPIDWGAGRAAARDSLVGTVEALGYLAGGRIEVERFACPADWAAQGLERGTPFALAHLFFQSGPFRPDNVDARVPGLVLVGAGTRPGVGIPMVLISGRLAAERVEQMAVGWH